MFAATAAALAGASNAQTQTQTPTKPVPLTVHEWGTFTSIAGPDGQAVQWLPQAGPADLPCFVERNPMQVKGLMPGTVRMETPVLYFYSPREIEASVRVEFPRGILTEWYPHATVTTRLPSVAGMNGAIAWPSVRVTPGATEQWPRGDGESHYYTARATAADPVLVGSQPEKFLFYRGVGQFQPPLAAIAREDGGADVRSVRGIPIGDVILFENRRGAATFTAQRVRGNEVTLTRPDLDDASGPPLAELKRTLIANGLFEKEAQAMVDTWKDSWFEEGSRLLYIVPPVDVDAVLPLTITPAPSAIARVFVGRIELVTPATLRDVSAALKSGDRAVLAKYGRFLQPIASRAGLGASVTDLTNAYTYAASSCR
jgi:hypothetical protein